MHIHEEKLKRQDNSEGRSEEPQKRGKITSIRALSNQGNCDSRYTKQRAANQRNGSGASEANGKYFQGLWSAWVMLH